MLNQEEIENMIRPIAAAAAAAAAAKLLQSCPTLCNPIDGSPPGSAIPGILQARTLEWFAISFSNAWKWKVKVKSLSHVRLFVTPWTVVHQAPLSMGFSRQEYWSGLPLPSLDQTNYKYRNWICNLKIPNKQKFRTRWFHRPILSHLEELMPILLKLFQKFQRKEYSQTHSMRAPSPWY